MLILTELTAPFQTTTLSSSFQHSQTSSDPGRRVEALMRSARTMVIGESTGNSMTIVRTPSLLRSLAALDRMEAHRNFHAAESGQLVPRSRRQSAEQQPNSQQSSSVPNLVEEQATHRAISWPITNGEVLGNVNASQKIQTMSSPYVVPFRAFVETHPPPRAPPSAWTDKTQERLDEKLKTEPKRHIVITNTKNNATTSSTNRNTRGETENGKAEQRFPLVNTQTRSINSGFEVLPAGSSGLTGPVKEFNSRSNSLPEQKVENVRPKKLQKRNRSGSRGKRTSTDGVRFSEDSAIAVS